VEKWIDDSLKYKRCVVVLIGSETANRKWVKYEIKRAWELKKGLFGIHIHNLRVPRTGTCSKGANPFSNWNVNTAIPGKPRELLRPERSGRIRRHPSEHIELGGTRQ
jgi:hypothetical protein